MQSGTTKPASPRPCPLDNLEAQIRSRSWRKAPASGSTGRLPSLRWGLRGCHPSLLLCFVRAEAGLSPGAPH